MTTLLATDLMTADEYLLLSDSGVPTELVCGKVVEMNRPYTAHGYFMVSISALLREFVVEQDLGRIVGGDAGVVTHRFPDTVRGPDIAYYSYERVPRGPIPMEGYWPVPELVIEIRSPEDRWKQIHHKIGEYLDAGVLSVVVVDPSVQTAHVFSADRPVEALNVDDELRLEDILPGFRVAVRKLFE